MEVVIFIEWFHCSRESDYSLFISLVTINHFIRNLLPWGKGAGEHVVEMQPHHNSLIS